MISNFVKEIEAVGINFLDIGSSGSLDVRWNPIKKYLNLFGFDPNEEDCEIQNKKNLGFKTSKFIPYAVSDKTGVCDLYKTKSIYCYSLLKPNTNWLNRFSFHELFDVLGVEKIKTVRLSEISEINSRQFDILKIDTQGLEIPILNDAKIVLDEVFYLETENGFAKNYINESTFAEIDMFLKDHNFMLFDINTNHRVSRKNKINGEFGSREQILWAESVWLKDYITIFNENPNFELNREKAIKILIICAFQGCYSYGLELAELFKLKNYITEEELFSLLKIEGWQFTVEATSAAIIEERKSDENSVIESGIVFKIKKMTNFLMSGK